MSFNEDFVEEFDVGLALTTTDLSATTTPSGAPVTASGYLGIDGFESVCILLYADKSTAAGVTANEDVGVNMYQATDSAGAGKKALNITNYYTKIPGGSATDLASGVGSFARVKLTTPTNVIAPIADTAEKQVFYAIEIQEHLLDLPNGFKFIGVEIPDVGGEAQNGTVLMFGKRKRNGVGSQFGIL